MFKCTNPSQVHCQGCLAIRNLVSDGKYMHIYVWVWCMWSIPSTTCNMYFITVSRNVDVCVFCIESYIIMGYSHILTLETWNLHLLHLLTTFPHCSLVVLPPTTPPPPPGTVHNIMCSCPVQFIEVGGGFHSKCLVPPWKILQTAPPFKHVKLKVIYTSSFLHPKVFIYHADVR